MTSPCQKCDEHDAETKRLFRSIFSEDELVLMLTALIMDVGVRQSKMDQLPFEDIRRQIILKDIARVGDLLGKFVVSFDDVYRQKLVKNLRKMGVKLDIGHGACPHKEQATDDATPTENTTTN